MLRRPVLALSLLAAAIAMSGCWGRVAGPTGGHQVLVIKPAITDRIVRDATDRCGTGQHRGGCAAETIRALCYEVPLSQTNPISPSYCLSITWTDHYSDIERAISQDQDCLVAEMGIPGSWGRWLAVPLGTYGCKN